MGLVNCRHISLILWETSFALASALQLISAVQFLWGSSGLLIVQVIFQVLSLAFLAAWETAFVERPANVVEDAWFFSWAFLFALYNILALIDAANTMNDIDVPREHVFLQLGTQIVSFIPLTVFRFMRLRDGYHPVPEE